MTYYYHRHWLTHKVFGCPFCRIYCFNYFHSVFLPWRCLYVYGVPFPPHFTNLCLKKLVPIHSQNMYVIFRRPNTETSLIPLFSYLASFVHLPCKAWAEPVFES
jgi:hypothetical protein